LKGVGVQSFNVLTAKIYLITKDSGGRQVLNAGTTAGFVKRLAVSSSELFKSGNRGTLADFFIGWPNSKQNQYSVAYSLPTSKAIGN
jgi:hypothetical protein